MKIKFLLLFLIVFQFAISQSDEKSDIKEINKNGYTISYPSDLKLEESGELGREFLLYKDYTHNLNLIIQNLDFLNLDLNKFVEITESQIKAYGNLISSERIKIDNSEFQKIIFSTHSQSSGFDLKFIQYDFVENNKAYILTFTAIESEFDKYSSEMEKIMKTFKVKPNAQHEYKRNSGVSP